ncbi:MAG: murein L,D-transpeptidase catalytic domain family protein [Chlorobiaceae bacterium]|nr:murein L,D-transpeptidase catalytic domain family protein [Chlorobiaceae bacterium]
MRKGAITILRSISVVLLMLLPLVVAALFRDAGHVPDEAVAEARSSLEQYMMLHPEYSARTLAVVDFSRPSFLKRMEVIDLQTGKRWTYRVAHGKNSGEIQARRFSNVPESNMSSLGLFRVDEAYYGDHGLAMRLDGLDSLQNGNAAMRDIVLHSADYVSIPYILLNLFTFSGPRIGRSNGCFVVARDDVTPVVSKLTGGGFIYAWDGKAKQH